MNRRVLARARQLIKGRGDEVSGDFEALLLEVGEDLVSLLGKAKHRGTGDVHLWVWETSAKVFLEFRLRLREPFLVVVAHYAVSSSVGGFVGR